MLGTFQDYQELHSWKWTHCACAVAHDEGIP
jgi:hypothetical protein